FALLFCWKIRQGLKRNIETDRMKKYVSYFWKLHYFPHFYEEETVLFILEDDPGCRRAVREHREIEQLIREIEVGLTDAAKLELLADKVEQHVRFEERELFPHLEKALSAEQLRKIQ